MVRKLCVLQAPSIYRHLPGKHDQETHGSPRTVPVDMATAKEGMLNVDVAYLSARNGGRVAKMSDGDITREYDKIAKEEMEMHNRWLMAVKQRPDYTNKPTKRESDTESYLQTLRTNLRALAGEESARRTGYDVPKVFDNDVPFAMKEWYGSPFGTPRPDIKIPAYRPKPKS